MTKRLKRTGRDGPVNVSRCDRETIAVYVEHEGEIRTLRMTEWNARRVLALLSVVLEMPLSKSAAKEIEL